MGTKKANNGLSLIFLDIDGTLVDSGNNFRVNSRKLRFRILKMQREGFVFGLNSNRSLHDLLPVAKRFGIRGPIVGENGIFLYEKGNLRILANSSQRRAIINSLTNVRKILSSELSSMGIEYKLIDCDTVKYLSRRSFPRYPNNALILLSNSFRKYTLNIHIKKSKNGRLENANREGKKLKYLLLSRYKKGNLSIAFSNKFSTLMVHSKDFSKSRALDYLMKRKYHRYKLYGIGDEMVDFKMVRGKGIFLTVGNAKPQIKSRATFVSKFGHARGVEDILSRVFK